MVIDFDPENVENQLKADLPIMYGDASRREVLEHAGIKRARVIVITPSDPEILLRTAELAHRLNPDVHVICRVRYSRLIEDLKAVGASTIIAEDVAVSQEITRSALAALK